MCICVWIMMISVTECFKILWNFMNLKPSLFSYDVEYHLKIIIICFDAVCRHYCCGISFVFLFFFLFAWHNTENGTSSNKHATHFMCITFWMLNANEINNSENSKHFDKLNRSDDFRLNPQKASASIHASMLFAWHKQPYPSIFLWFILYHWIRIYLTYFTIHKSHINYQHLEVFFLLCYLIHVFDIYIFVLMSIEMYKWI